jgi:hypothetical protein
VISFHAFIGYLFFRCIVAPSCVDLIPGASRAIVLSDVWTGAARRAGELGVILVGCGEEDRVPPRAMRPEEASLGRKSFSLLFVFRSAKLFTAGCGELGAAALLAGG